MVAVLGYGLFAFGAFVCCTNFYLSFLRHPLHKALGREVKWVSGIPLIGSLLLAIAVAILHQSPTLFWSGTGIGLIDSGLHWFAGVMLWMWLRGCAFGQRYDSFVRTIQ